MGNYPFISMPLVLWKRNQGIGQYFAYSFGLSNGAKEHVIWFVSVVRGGRANVFSCACFAGWLLLWEGGTSPSEEASEVLFPSYIGLRVAG